MVKPEGWRPTISPGIPRVYRLALSYRKVMHFKVSLVVIPRKEKEIGDTNLIFIEPSISKISLLFQYIIHIKL